METSTRTVGVAAVWGRQEYEAQARQILASHALGRLNTLQDAASFITFLDGMTHVSGQLFQLDSRIRAWT